jgi:hypothetical protein
VEDVRGMTSRSPAFLAAIGIGATLVVALMVVSTLWLVGDVRLVSQNAALIGALIALGGVFTTQLVNTGLEAQRAREAALQKYFEQVGKLLVEHPEDPNLSTVVRAQSLAVLEGLDPDRKRILLQFLYESNLIKGDKPVISLMGANLVKANLSGTHLRGASLRFASLRGASLRGADLAAADLFGADLRGADLRKAENLAQKQISQTAGDKHTKIPDHLHHPEHWLIPREFFGGLE